MIAIATIATMATMATMATITIMATMAIATTSLIEMYNAPSLTSSLLSSFQLFNIN